MPRPATGSIESYAWRDRRTVTWRLRFRAYGRRYRIDLGTNHEGWNEDRARVELERIMGAVERGTWSPPERTPAHETASEDETVHITASRWWSRRERDLRPNTREDYRWRLSYILRHLAATPTGSVTIAVVDDFREQLAGSLSPRSVNMILDVLAQVLDDAIDYGLLELNPARGRRRRMKVPKSSRSFLDPDQVLDLLEVAGEWEADVREDQRYGRRALLAALCLAGPRISELLTATRGDLDVHGGRLRIADSKTDAGVRDVELSTFLLSELRAHLASVPARLSRDHDADLPIFPTRSGSTISPSNVRMRLLHGLPATKTRKRVIGVVERANERRAAEGKLLLPSRVTPHVLRRTYASLALAAGRDPRWVMGQMGHSDARLTLSVYAQVVQRERVDRESLDRLMTFQEESEVPESEPARS